MAKKAATAKTESKLKNVKPAPAMSSINPWLNMLSWLDEQHGTSKSKPQRRARPIISSSISPKAKRRNPNEWRPEWRPRKADRPKCGAKTRRGTACLRQALANGRCPNHGGLSTGPRTPEGRERCRQAALRRWAKIREQQAEQHAAG